MGAFILRSCSALRLTHVLDQLAEGLAGLFPLGGRTATKPWRSYRRAWRLRTKSGDTSTKLLTDTLKQDHVRGVYGPLESEPLATLLRCWEAGIEPQQARGILRSTLG